MKRCAAILFSLLLFLAALPAGAQLTYSPQGDLLFLENLIYVILGDSWMRDGDSTSPQTGGMFPCYVMSDVFLMNPDKTNQSVYVYARSGGTMNDFISNIASLGLPSWGYKSNSYPLMGLMSATENGSDNQSQMFQLATNAFAAVLRTTNGTAMTNEGGWSATATVGWIGIGEPPVNSSDGGPTTHGVQSFGVTNAAGVVGGRGIDAWTDLRSACSNDSVLRSGTNFWVTGVNKTGHLLPGGELAWFYSYKRGTAPSDTNVSLASVSWASATVISTNHCVVSGVSRSGNSLTYTRLDTRQPFGFDAAGALDQSGNTLTNDCTSDFTTIRPADADYLHYDVIVPDAPTGNYDVLIDGELCGHNVSSATLAKGWNMVTNTVGPIARARLEVLGRCRDIFYMNRITRVEGPSGDGVGFPGLGSFVGGQYPTHTGDGLIAAMHGKISGLQTNLTASFKAIRAAAQPTPHTFTITQVVTVFAPFTR